METQLRGTRVCHAADLKNFLKGMETSYITSIDPTSNVLKNFLKGMETIINLKLRIRKLSVAC